MLFLQAGSIKIKTCHINQQRLNKVVKLVEVTAGVKVFRIRTNYVKNRKKLLLPLLRFHFWWSS